MTDAQRHVLILALTPVARRGIAERWIERTPAEFAISFPASADEAIQRARATRPTIALLHSQGWGQREAMFAAELQVASPRTALCLTTAQPPDPFALAAGGVRGWIRPSEHPERWRDALRAVASGGSWLLPLFAAWLLLNLEAEHLPLPREIEVLRHIRQGKQYGEVAALLDTTETELRRSIRRALNAVVDLLNRFGDGGFEASGDRAPRSPPNAPPSLNAALPLPSEPRSRLDEVTSPIDRFAGPEERSRHSA
jgi:DNA-binding NarL/FixJ family response regulator